MSHLTDTPLITNAVSRIMYIKWLNIHSIDTGLYLMQFWAEEKLDYIYSVYIYIYIYETYSHVRWLWQDAMQNPGHTSEWGIANLLTLSALPQGYSSCVCVSSSIFPYNNKLAKKTYAKKTSALQKIELKHGIFRKTASSQSYRNPIKQLLVQLSAILLVFIHERILITRQCSRSS